MTERRRWAFYRQTDGRLWTGLSDFQAMGIRRMQTEDDVHVWLVWTEPWRGWRRLIEVAELAFVGEVPAVPLGLPPVPET